MHAVPGKVSNVHVTAIGSETLSIAWNPRDDVTLYEIRRWELRDVTRISVNMTSSSNFTLVRLTEDTQYSFQVISVVVVFFRTNNAFVKITSII